MLQPKGDAQESVCALTTFCYSAALPSEEEKHYRLTLETAFVRGTPPHFFFGHMMCLSRVYKPTPFMIILSLIDTNECVREPA